jgi:hypothetical protein
MQHKATCAVLQVTPVPGVSAEGGVDVLVASYWENS